MKASNKNKEYLFIKAITPEDLDDKKVKSIFDPSSGGIGTKLNKPKAMFIKTTVDAIK